MPLGTSESGGRSIDLRFDGSFSDIDEIRSLPVGASDDGTVIRLSDVAEVNVVYSSDDYSVTSMGKDIVLVDVSKRSDGNTVQITADGGYGDSVSWDEESNKLSVNHPSRHDAGTVTLTVTSAAGQTDTIDVTVTVYSSIGFDSAPGADGFYTYMLD